MVVDSMLDYTPRFGRLVSPVDARDNLYAIATRYPEVLGVTRIRRKKWTTGPVLDQGVRNQYNLYNSCVGQTGKQLMMTTPIRARLEEPPTALDLYIRCREIDENPYNNDLRQDTGTTIRGLAKALTELGRLKSYVWANTVEEVVSWLISRGPVICGAPWPEGYNKTDVDGYVHQTGALVGGHCFLLYGADRDIETVYAINSWGIKYGLAGKFKITFASIDTMFSQDAEFCTMVERMLK